MATEEKRSYYLPKKLIDAADKGCREAGLVRQRVVAAALLHFLRSSPTQRQTMFENLAKFVGKGA
jgi:hypothetical protein